MFFGGLGRPKVFERVSSPYFEDMEAFYGLIGDTAVIEMAACAGLPLVEGRKNPSLTTSYGVGQLIMAAAKGDAKNNSRLGRLKHK